MTPPVIIPAAKRKGDFAADHNNLPGVFRMNKVASIKGGGQPERGSALWLDQMIDEATTPRVEVVDMTPELAEHILTFNPSNRLLRVTKIFQYASDMAAGRWQLNGEPVIIATDGHLNDGQHRLEAVRESKTTVQMLLMFGIERETRLTVDQGAARTAGDFLSMEGHQTGNTIAAIARMIIAFENGGGRAILNTGQITSSEIRARVERDPLIKESSTFGSTNGKYSRAFAAGTVIGFCHYVLSKIDKDEAEDFLSRLCRGDNLKHGQPAYVLREKLITVGRLSRDRKVKLILQSWNFHREGKMVRASSMDSTLPLPSRLL